ncbi:hypothetical protein [Aureimonas leprariae]|uniref:Uncharacterized protein n=1 Tax=Plantimonas leprariae TaxID=2615207 RepID=A0A7V7PQ33_9HYPH|nr:hypothetical protein [Aureimonas leprariae]KAB0680180.1 hypothetical protein F6X38_08295 [Aureimonas leprariae]
MATLLAYNPDRFRTAAAKQRMRIRDRLRKRIAAEIQRLVDILDELDGDADFEPSLGWTKTMAWGATDDREEPHAAACCAET